MNFSFHLKLLIFFSFSLQFFQALLPGNETDNFALLRFKAGIISDPDRIFNSWNDSLPFCQWYGITCSRRHQRVTSMVLEGHDLIGSISPFIGNLSFLRILNLRNNSLNSRIPQEVGNLVRLQVLYLNNSIIQGEIPINLTYCSQLRRIDLSKNNLTGKIPAAFGSLLMLQLLRISENNLRGEIPPSFGNLSSLTYLSAGQNSELEGKIPDELGKLKILRYFFLPDCKLSGKFPLSIFNISSVRIISAGANELDGNLPENIGFALPNLFMFGIGSNQFSGSIPNSLCNASQLELFDVVLNNFVGFIPNCLGNLQDLQWINVGYNSLGNSSAADLAFLSSLSNCSNLQKLHFESNNFGGVLPHSVANLSAQLSSLVFASNQITGNVPQGLENLVNIIELDIGNNLLNGSIPFSFGKFQKLQALVLDGNKFSGSIPSSIGNLTQLSLLSLSRNKLEGSIPTSIGNCQRLQNLDVSENNLNGSIPNVVLHLSSLSRLLNLSQNSLTGKLPVDVGKLTNINALDVSGNSLSGNIPATLGSCLSLEYLYLQGNIFQGSIPSSLALLKGLQKLDLSRNNLTGEIPDGLQRLLFLSYLNISFNNLVGEIPMEGVFRNATAVSLMGNNMLCGSVMQLHQPKCPSKATKKGRSIAFKLAIIIPCAVFCVLFVLAAVIAYRRREQKKKRMSAVRKELDSLAGILQVSYRDLFDATSGFSTGNLIGSGSFGYVYQGFLKQLERPVAIKVLKLETIGASKSFLAECKVLREVRHRNLVKLLTYCSSIDYKHNEFKALVYEFMENGSLEQHIHVDNHSGALSLLQRLNIAIDVASALHYLHDLCENPIVHRDLKPSNVLLDHEMVARLSDFGLARLLSTTSNDASQSQTSSIGIRGTVGYAPPEYGMVAEATKEGDVYSYGILVLEMFTGKRPTDERFEGHLNLHNFVKNAQLNRLVEITDPTLFARGMEETATTISNQGAEDHETSNRENLHRLSSKEKECLVSVFRIGVACSSEIPYERMSIKDVAKELDLIRTTFLA
ncbi:putative receptor-like protein kinase At3g47110 [Euphorbia lathyris]|uniref:putative receptor-like protein kinase At3g47110 n=1 Tax=Euphorbia lathyris TaxID=212925 RepID=UPI003313BAF7